MEGKNILVYPFTIETYPLAKLLIEKNLDVTFASPVGTSLVGNDLAYCINRECMNKNILSLDEALSGSQYDEILIPMFEEYKLIKDDFKKIELYARERNIKIKSIEELDDIIYEVYKGNINEIEHIMNNLDRINAKYYEEINAIVIFVVNLFESIDSNLVSTMISEKFKKSDNVVSVISTKKDSIFSNGYIYPDEFFKNPDIPQRVITLNRFIQAVEINESPDIIIFEIPGGMMRNDEFWHNDFGIYLHLIGLAAKPDYVITTVPFDMANNEFLDGLNDKMLSQYNKKIDIFNVTNTFFNITQHTIPNINKPIYVNSNIVRDIVNELKLIKDNVMCLDSSNDFNVLKTKIIDDLS